MSSDQDRRDDLTGKKDFGWNVMFVWLGQIVTIFSGFIMPRLIDSSLSQEALGIWDLGWSTVAYFRLLGLGLAGGLNRYVAYYKSREELNKMREAVASTTFLQIAIALITISCAGLLGYYSTELFDSIPVSLRLDTSWLIALLGTALAIKMLCWQSRGILTGNHRWATNITCTGIGDILLILGLSLALFLGGGLISLGVVYVFCSMITESIRSVQARRVYGEPLLQRRYIKRRMLRRMFTFGMKTNLLKLPDLIVNQTITILLLANLGPAILAIYSRPGSLARQALTVVGKFSSILSSSTGSLAGLGASEELKSHFLMGSRSAVAIGLPMLLFIGIHGDLLILLWMGNDYIDPLLAPVISLGCLIPLFSSAAGQVLLGLNAHGKIGIYTLVVSLLLLAIGVIALDAIGWSAVSAAAMGSIIVAIRGLMITASACKQLGVRLWEFLAGVFPIPVICNIPFTAALLIPRLSESLSAVQVLASTMIGGFLLALVYWAYLLEPSTKSNLISRIRAAIRRKRPRPS